MISLFSHFISDIIDTGILKLSDLDGCWMNWFNLKGAPALSQSSLYFVSVCVFATSCSSSWMLLYSADEFWHLKYSRRWERASFWQQVSFCGLWIKYSWLLPAAVSLSLNSQHHSVCKWDSGWENQDQSTQINILRQTLIRSEAWKLLPIITAPDVGHICQ